MDRYIAVLLIDILINRDYNYFYRRSSRMGSALYIVLERDLAGVDTMMDGKSLSHEIDHITSLCRKLEAF
jgi:hypothetical protein